MRVARILVVDEGCFQMTRRCFVFSASIKGQAECDVRWSETGITFERFGVCVAGIAFFALLIKREAFDVALFRTLNIFRICNRPRRRFEIRIVIDRRVGVLFK